MRITWSGTRISAGAFSNLGDPIRIDRGAAVGAFDIFTFELRQILTHRVGRFAGGQRQFGYLCREGNPIVKLDFGVRPVDACGDFLSHFLHLLVASVAFQFGRGGTVKLMLLMSPLVPLDMLATKAGN